MAERLVSRAWWMCALYLVIVAVIVFCGLLPLGPGAGRLPGPDLLVALSFAWVLRRPDYVPVAVLALVAFTADLLTMRPPGLWAAITVLGVETARGRTGNWADMPFLLELAVVGAILSVMYVAYAVLLGVFFVGQPPIGQTLVRLLATLCFYPLVVLVTQSVFRIRRAPETGAAGGIGA